MTTDFQQIADRYIAVWNETDPPARRAGVESLFTDDARYVDPLADAQGPAAIDALIGAVQDRFAGMRFALVGAADGHHEQVRFSWELGPAGEAAPIAGFDVAETSAGRISRVLGFLDRVPS